MKVVTLTMRQRLSLESLLGAQRGTLDELFICHDIREKIKVVDREQYIKQLPSGTILVDEGAVDSAEPVQVELEKAEIQKVSKLLKEWPQFSTADIDWIIPLQKQLES